MTAPFQSRFVALARQRSPLCVGIDPSRESLAEWGVADDADGLRLFCGRLVEASAALVAAVKPQVAFFERFGPEGLDILRRTVDRAREYGTLVILDAKRGDIASTATAYGEAFLGRDSAFGGDAMTVSAYLGFGSLDPILDVARAASAGVFVVVRSSNPEGTEVQSARLADGRSVAEYVADRVTSHNAGHEADGLGPIGAVVGATLGDETASLVARLPNALLLVPGIGAQGATVGDVRAHFGAHFPRVIPAISRGISRAGPDLAALRRRIERYVAEIRDAD
ncbi:MAG: orotidine-5'-phosphate decarboxylase [Alphaproteobacteria bacterium]|nr:orotidine-5'-phosphate decarboxylase [Alphaproteobacteria bacterium]MBV9554023.1 orotidine-5'-phosphate decarboxylase [Alphaproteobacteria bacterium]